MLQRSSSSLRALACHHWFVAPTAVRRLSTAAADLVDTGGDEEAHRSGSKSLWGGRFTKGTDDSVKEWVDSTPIDKHMGREDMWGSMAHVAMLGATDTIPPKDAAAILGGLRMLHDEFVHGSWQLDPAYDDVHMNVEKALIDRLGMDVAGKMHTTRSRNDQVALDARMMARAQLLRLREKVADAAEALIERSGDHLDDVMIGYTHVQHAQPISVAYWLQSYAASMVRSLERLDKVVSHCHRRCSLSHCHRRCSLPRLRVPHRVKHYAPHGSHPL